MNPYTQQYHTPAVITGITVLPPEGEDKNRALAQIDTKHGLTLSFSVLPDIGDEIMAFLEDGQTLILKVVDRLHYSKEMKPGVTMFKSHEMWVDVTLTCRQISMFNMQSGGVTAVEESKGD